MCTNEASKSILENLLVSIAIVKARAQPHTLSDDIGDASGVEMSREDIQIILMSKHLPIEHLA